MSTIVFDIETVGGDFSGLDEISQAALLKRAKTEEEIQEVKDSLGLSPLTGEIVTIAMLECESDNATVLFRPTNETPTGFTEAKTEYIACSEKEMLERFWQQMKLCRRFVTFNGRGFDCPYLIVRSGILRVKPTRELMPYRYDARQHVDLFDQLSFYGAVRRAGGLHLWTRAFGIKSPKADGVSGEQVQELFQQGQIARIARYCMEDVRATKELFLCWDRYMKVDG